MDGTHTVQLQLDFRTGRPTTISGPCVTSAERAACSALNRQRARGIHEVSQLSPARESLPADVWEAAFLRKTTEWDVPLISLSKLGLIKDKDGFVESQGLGFPALKSGAEACPYHDQDAGVVYKLFYLRSNGALGIKLALELDGEDRFEINSVDAVLADTLEKIVVLHDAGAHPTEIVGLSDSGDYLIVKQPLAGPYGDFEADQKAAVNAICAIPLSCQGIRGQAVLTWVNERAWLVSDLHKGNIMRDSEGRPTIIDALVGPVPPLAFKRFLAIRHAVEDAQNLRNGDPVVSRSFGAEVSDEEL